MKKQKSTRAAIDNPTTLQGCLSSSSSSSSTSSSSSSESHLMYPNDDEVCVAIDRAIHPVHIPPDILKCIAKLLRPLFIATGILHMDRLRAFDPLSEPSNWTYYNTRGYVSDQHPTESKRVHSAATLMLNDWRSMMVSGGYTWQRSHLLADAMILDLETREYKRVPSMPYVRRDHALAQVGQRVFCFGGNSSVNSKSNGDVSVFNLDSMQWLSSSSLSYVSSMKSPHCRPTYTTVKNRLYVMGRSSDNDQRVRCEYVDTDAKKSVDDNRRYSSVYSQSTCGVHRRTFACHRAVVAKRVPRMFRM